MIPFQNVRRLSTGLALGLLLFLVGMAPVARAASTGAGRRILFDDHQELGGASTHLHLYSVNYLGRGLRDLGEGMEG